MIGAEVLSREGDGRADPPVSGLLPLRAGDPLQDQPSGRRRECLEVRVGGRIGVQRCPQIRRYLRADQPRAGALGLVDDGLAVHGHLTLRDHRDCRFALTALQVLPGLRGVKRSTELTASSRYS
jgi:hypothetical protein